MFKPFILLYTHGLDVEYYYPLLPILFIIPRILTSLRIPSIVTINISGDFKQVKKYAVFEAIINLTLSLIFVKLWGIYGVLIATIIAAAYRTPVLINYSYRKILLMNPATVVAKVIPWMVLFGACTTISFFCDFGNRNFVDWTVSAIMCFVTVATVSLSILFFTDRTAFRQITSIVLKNESKEAKA